VLPRAALVLAVGCGRFGFEPLALSTTDGGDSAGDAPRVMCDWSSGPAFRTAPVLRSDLSSPQSDLDPYLVPGDPRTIYLSSVRASVDYDIWTATRPVVDQPFGQVTPVPNFTTAADESGFNLEAGAQTGLVELNFKPYNVVRNGNDFALGSRITEIEFVPVIGDAFSLLDGTLLVFMAGADIAGDTDIYFASRSDRSAPWGNIQPFPFNTTNAEGGATLTADGLVIVWTSGNQTLDIFYSVRASTAVPFTQKQTLIATADDEHEPFIRDDGCELFFARFTPQVSQDLYSVEILP
jgi:hypothetical protein